MVLKVAKKLARRSLFVENLEPRDLLASDMVIEWNDNVLDAIRVDRTAPPRASRILAIVHTAVYDTVNAIDRTHKPYAVDVPALPGTSAEAAVAGYGTSVKLVYQWNPTSDCAMLYGRSCQIDPLPPARDQWP